MMSSAFVGAAMLHPSMARLADHQEVPPPLSRARLVLLSAAASTPVMLLITRPLTGIDTSGEVLGWMAAALFIVVIVRSWGLVGAVVEVSRLRSNERFAALSVTAPMRSSSSIRMVVLTVKRRLDRVWSRPPPESTDPGFEQWVWPSDRHRFTEFLTQLRALSADQTLSIKVRMQRPGDLGHLGGDEFAMLLDAAEGIDGLQGFAEQLMVELQRPVVIHSGQVPVSVSMGISVADGDTQPQSVMRRADLAMYQAKRSGKRGIRQFSPDLGQRFNDEMDCATVCPPQSVKGSCTWSPSPSWRHAPVDCRWPRSWFAGSIHDGDW